MAEEESKHETVTLDVPGRILRDLRFLVDAGIYLSVEEALRESILANWRFIRGSYHSIRLEPKGEDDDEALADPAGAAPTETGTDGESSGE